MTSPSSAHSHNESFKEDQKQNGNPDQKRESSIQSIRTIFETVTSMVQTSSPPLPLSDEIKLKLYGLYKRATIGPCCCSNTNGNDSDSSSPMPNTAPPPPRWNIVAYRKYKAWEECDALTVEESMEQYIELVSSINCDLGRESAALLQDIRDTRQRNKEDVKVNVNVRQDEEIQIKMKTNKESRSLSCVNSVSVPISIDESSKIPSLSLPSKNINHHQPSLITKLTGLKPFTPRGQLDISTYDLLSTFFKSIPTPFNKTCISTNIRIEEDIQQLWKEQNSYCQTNTIKGKSKYEHQYQHKKQHILTGLSVRSLLDLYLSAKSYRKGSEVIIVPPISIEGLIDVMQYHNIKVVPIDIEPYENNADPVLNVDVEKVRKAISVNTVAVLIVHPFGLVCMNNDDFFDLKQMIIEESRNYYDGDNDSYNNGSGDKRNANRCRIEIWEDCAECYTGGTTNVSGNLLGYNGSPFADVQFYSFGMIKTATALGGGIIVIGENDIDTNNTMDDSSTKTIGPPSAPTIVNKMKRLQQMTYDDQSRMEYFTKVCKALLLHVISHNLIVLGIIIHVIEFLGIDYDHFVTSSVKGFPTVNLKHDRSGSKRRLASSEIIEENNIRARNLIKRLRKRPCVSLLLLLQQRIREATQTQRMVQRRVNRCNLMWKMIKENVPTIQLPSGCMNSSNQHLFWLFPIIVDDPDTLCKRMKRRGYDVPRGTSQLGCVSSFIVDNDNSFPCPNTKSMMDKILYLPIATSSMSKSEMEKMVLALKDSDSIGKEGISQRHILSWNQIANILYICLFFILDGSMTQIAPYSREIASGIVSFVSTLIPLMSKSALCIITILHILRMTVGRYYINCSDAFAKYNAIFYESNQAGNKSAMEHLGQGLKRVDFNKSFQQSSDLFESAPYLLPKVGFSSTKENRNFVLLTGGTGFIGSLLLRELLCHRHQLGIDGVVLICRSKREITADKRITNLLHNKMFSFLSDQDKIDLVVTIEGDVAAPNIGMSESDVLRLTKEICISHVFNCAACVRFTEPLEIAAESNITSALQLQQLAKKLDAKYIYLSTAFIHGNQNGSHNAPLAEHLYDFGHYNPLQLYKSMMSTQSYASKVMHDLGFPNTYTFSKSICEHLLMEEKSIETIIIRPSIVGPALQVPFEGWAGDKPSTLVAGACLYMKNPFNLWAFRHERAPVIPVDVVCRFVLAKSFDNSMQKKRRTNSFDNNSNFSDESCRSSELSYVFTKSLTMESDITATELNNSASEVSTKSHQIYTAAWSTTSPKQTGFLWYDFACAIVQLSSVNGHVELSIAYCVLLISFRSFLAMQLTFNSFQRVHKVLVQRPFHFATQICRLIRFHPNILLDLEKVSAFLDLPLLFFPFTTRTFHFSSELIAPPSVNGERYMVSCILAAEKFANIINNKETSSKKNISYHPKTFLIGGGNYQRGSSDAWWAITQPKGSYTIRFIGLFVSKLLHLTTTEVTVDMTSLSNVARSIKASSDDIKPFIILAPTHRSYLDFILLSFMTFSLPEIGIPTPNIAAADDFIRLPVVGLIAQLAGAFFVRRGKGSIDPGLKSKIDSLKSQHSDQSPTCIEVFLEGKRSRDRRFLRGKTGLLRCLNESGGKYLIIPITINYEKIPEQSGLVVEAEGNIGTKMSLLRLYSWLRSVFNNEVNLGRIHMVASDPLLMESSDEFDVASVTKIIQHSQQEQILHSAYHVKATAEILNLDTMTAERTFKKLGSIDWPYQGAGVTSMCTTSNSSSLSEKWTIFLQGAHLFSPLLHESHPRWAEWLNPLGNKLVSLELDDDLTLIRESLIRNFEAADLLVQSTISHLQEKGFMLPSSSHILQYASKWKKCDNIPMILIHAAIRMRSIIDDNNTCATSIIRPLFRNTRNDDSVPMVKNLESFGAWGYRDSKFILSVDRSGNKCVTMSGDRYNISGRSMPNLVPFLEKETNVKVDTNDTVLPYVDVEDLLVSKSDLGPHDLAFITTAIYGDKDRVSTAPVERARHGTGHSQEDMYIIRSGDIAYKRVPDVVVFPKDETEIENLLSLAAAKCWCIIPFGGGTNVSHATWCPPKAIEPRPIISVDMRLMKDILEINEEDGTIHVQAGITGGQLVKELEAIGYTMGHEPDSIEFSTVGGWIATKSSGMKRNKYGNIEDIVKEVRVVSAEGTLWQHSNGNGVTFGRVSTGTNLTSLIFGSEGALGIITSAVLKIWPLASTKTYESVVLHNFDDGVRFVKDVSKLRTLKPASIRLLDNTQFRLGQAMKAQGSFYGSLKSILTKTYANAKVGKFNSHDAVCATVAFEGSSVEVEIQQKLIRNLASKHNGICAGLDTGKAGYNMTYSIAYIRDFALTFGFLAESFETFVPWSKVSDLINSTKDRLHQEHFNRALPGKAIVCSRITQLYDEGVCVYFYFCMNFKDVPNPSAVFSEIETAARKEILANGGSLSHHHGIGKAKTEFMNEVNPENLKRVLMKVKDAFDPNNVFGVRNGSYA